MKVFSRDKYIEDKGLAGYCSNASWVNKCHMRTEEECLDMGIGIRNDWLVPCRGVKRRAKKDEYVYITEHNFDKTFSPGDVVKCVNDKTPCCEFENENGERSAVSETRYVVREIVEEEEKMENVKQLLKNGDMVITRDGEKYIFMKDYLGEDMFKDKDGDCWCLSLYDENLIFDDGLTIMEIKKPRWKIAKWFNEADYETKWKREEVKEMTVAEIEKLLGHKVKIIKEGK